MKGELNDSDTISTLDLVLGKGNTQAATKLLTTLATVLNEEELEDEVEEETGESSSSEAEESGVDIAYNKEVKYPIFLFASSSQ